MNYVMQVTSVLLLMSRIISAQNAQEQTVERTLEHLCNGSICDDLKPTIDTDNAALPGVNDETHPTTDTANSPTHNDLNNSFTLVPPFLIAAAVVMIAYMVINCLYLHCYAKRKMKKIAEMQYPMALVMREDSTTTGSVYTRFFSNEQGETEIMDGQPRIVYQPCDDNELGWQLEPHFISSLRSSTKSSSSGKKSISLKLPKIFGSQGSSETSCGPRSEQQISLEVGNSTRKQSFCLVPLERSHSVPAKKQQEQIPLKGFLSVIMSRTKSCKTAVTKKTSSKANDPQPCGSASDANAEPLIMTGSEERGDVFIQHATAQTAIFNVPTLNVIEVDSASSQHELVTIEK